MNKKTTVLMILDGFGLNEKTEGNAIRQANTPVLDGLMEKYPFVKGYASGLDVGLPAGQMGNSEVGHLNMGAGRVVYQELTRITKSIEDGDFFENPNYIVRYKDNMYQREVSNLVKGEEGTKVKITILRKDEYLEFDMSFFPFSYLFQDLLFLLF